MSGTCSTPDADHTSVEIPNYEGGVIFLGSGDNRDVALGRDCGVFDNPDRLCLLRKEIAGGKNATARIGMKVR
jgi:hypothetical protein